MRAEEGRKEEEEMREGDRVEDEYGRLEKGRSVQQSWGVGCLDSYVF